ncbi:hypothetical protein DTO027I6_6600 [Penicillium roqueforti]|uniref:uncharacterized protein n=1 Tax=Penicillium roqueforti TaxID=5082 RepID=UPI00190B4571|nr:uncharacterized protein LCP9604111_7271 [Penicillium roqueforti]KAF9244318.1 hypothetical protein LCP9604111_7271 [Penicillium roqueforti]KAI2721920.1 hypothetical protein CBS147318_2535 [Penicillium roqueforti]KAI3138133.1 hypothetical protein CBS147330_2553 [Penicillium roqueforti]KAI3154825.1 hypothetical protein CBS147317_5873 [Penicillium roqueforti]KAI3173751.1 hypothetical protein DTO039G3_2807 [Penicillium roqueforti]
MSPASVKNEQDSDSDSDVEFEDVPISLPNRPRNREDRGIPITIPATPQPQWTPTLSLPPQRSQPIPSGSEEEVQLRGHISTGIERVTYRKMKSDMGMDAPGTPASERRYNGFKELAADVEGLIDALWASATPAIQTEALITLAGLTQTSLPAFPFDAPPTLNILYKLDSVFAALCTGTHPLTGAVLPGAQLGHSLVTETQKVRIRSLAERTRYEVFSCLEKSKDGVNAGTVNTGGYGYGDDEDEASGDEVEPWMLEATRVYEKSLMLLAEQDPEVDAGMDEFNCL